MVRGTYFIFGYLDPEGTDPPVHEYLSMTASYFFLRSSEGQLGATCPKAPGRARRQNPYSVLLVAQRGNTNTTNATANANADAGAET